MGARYPRVRQYLLHPLREFRRLGRSVLNLVECTGETVEIINLIIRARYSSYSGRSKRDKLELLPFFPMSANDEDGFGFFHRVA